MATSYHSQQFTGNQAEAEDISSSSPLTVLRAQGGPLLLVNYISLLAQYWLLSISGGLPLWSSADQGNAGAGGMPSIKQPHT